MPHITVEYSAALADHFDRRAFALALHPLTAKVIDTTVAACKTRFRRADELVMADGEPGHEMIYIELAILSGRTAQVKAELSEAVLALAREYTAGVRGPAVHIAVDVADLDRDWYRAHVEPAAGR